MTDLSAFQHPRFARAYERISMDSERRGTARYRERMLAGLHGRVIEIGADNGLNFAHYPATVTEVVAVEPEDRLRAAGQRAAERAAVPVRVTAGHAGALPGEDGSFDAAVATLVLCSVDDVPAALAELRRVLCRGGELRFFEHVRSLNPLLGCLQGAIGPLWSRAAGGCRLNRDTAAHLDAAGFRIEDCAAFPHAPSPSLPAHRHLLGRARTPG